MEGDHNSQVGQGTEILFAAIQTVPHHARKDADCQRIPFGIRQDGAFGCFRPKTFSASMQLPTTHRDDHFRRLLHIAQPISLSPQPDNT